MLNAALIVAAGRGTRATSDSAKASVSNHVSTAAAKQLLPPKQYVRIGGEMVLTRTLRPFLSANNIHSVLVVIHPDDRDLYDTAIAELANNLTNGNLAKLQPPVMGGQSRQISVAHGLEALKADKTPDTVLVHDGARAFLTHDIINSVLAALTNATGAIAALPVSDTLKRATKDQLIANTLDREGLWRAQTPQGFRFSELYAAHKKALADELTNFTDDAAIAEWAGLDVALVMGSAANIKLTTSEDLSLADQSLRQLVKQVQDQSQDDYSDDQCNDQHSWPDMRVGTGYDVHRFAAGDHLWLCGVNIAFNQTLEGHSDADVGLHALTDALLGAIGERDIGSHFPPSDPGWKGAASDQFLIHAVSLLTALGGRINNVDVTLICEAPKIGPHRNDMRARLSEILQLELGRISVKATTTERLGFTGRGEGIAAMASITVVLPPNATK